MDVIKYWKNRYEGGGNSGVGSYNDNAEFKGKILNQIFNKYNIDQIIDFGCGDGNQLKYLELENINYNGFDVSDILINKLRDQYKEYNFYYYSERYNIENKILTMSIDVIYHLVDDVMYKEYMNSLFYLSNKYVVIFSSNYDGMNHGHVKHRKFTDYIDENFKNFKLIENINNELNIDAHFFVYEKINE